MRTVGIPSRYSELPSPQEAWRRGLALDLAVERMQPSSQGKLLPPMPARPRVQRLTHEQMNAQDDARMLARASLLNGMRPDRG